MKNSFKIEMDNHVLRSTDDYHIMAEIVRVDNGVETKIFEWYREESGFSFKFSVEDPWGGNPENAVLFAKLFHILVRIVDYFMLGHNEQMRLGQVLGSMPESVKKIIESSGLRQPKRPDDIFLFAEEEFGEELDKDDDEDYNDEDWNHGHEDFED